MHCMVSHIITILALNMFIVCVTNALYVFSLEVRCDLCYDRVHTSHITILTSSLPSSSVSVLKAVSVVSFLAADWSHDASTGL